MRIDVNLPASLSIENDSRKTQISANRSSGTAMSSDSASLSADSVSLNSFRAEVAKMPDVRQEQVNSLRLAIQNGTYKTDASSTAAAMLSEFYGGSATVN